MKNQLRSGFNSALRVHFLKRYALPQAPPYVYMFAQIIPSFDHIGTHGFPFNSYYTEE